MGHEVGRSGDIRTVWKWKGVMRMLFSSHIGRRGDEKFFYICRMEGSVLYW
jgi:hypothetical protein